MGERTEIRKAIDILQRLQEPEPWEPSITEETFNALELAITALKKEEMELLSDQNM